MNKEEIDEMKPIYIEKFPEYHVFNFQNISTLMRINVEILKKEITDHVDKELKRFKDETKNRILNE